MNRRVLQTRDLLQVETNPPGRYTNCLQIRSPRRLHLCSLRVKKLKVKELRVNCGTIPDNFLCKDCVAWSNWGWEGRSMDVLRAPSPHPHRLRSIRVGEDEAQMERGRVEENCWLDTVARERVLHSICGKMRKLMNIPRCPLANKIIESPILSS